MDTPLYTSENLPIDYEAPGGNAWSYFQKKTHTKAIRIEGRFEVVTIHGGEPQVCEDGWLALDSAGQPYPIADEVFQATFAPVQGVADAATIRLNDAQMNLVREGKTVDIGPFSVHAAPAESGQLPPAGEPVGDTVKEMDIPAVVEERYGAWLDVEDIRMLVRFVDGDVDGGALEELGTLAKLKAIEERAA